MFDCKRESEILVADLRDKSLRKGGIFISNLKLTALQDVFDCYGRENLVPIDLLKQVIFYTARGVQPVFTCESEKEDRKGQIVCWFLKSETQWVYRKWKENRPM